MNRPEHKLRWGSYQGVPPLHPSLPMSKKTEFEKRSRLRVSPPGRGIYATIYTLIVLLTIVCGLTVTEVCSGWSAYSLISGATVPPPAVPDFAPRHNMARLGSIVEQIEAADKGRASLHRNETAADRKLSDRESTITY